MSTSTIRQSCLQRCFLTHLLEFSKFSKYSKNSTTSIKPEILKDLSVLNILISVHPLLPSYWSSWFWFFLWDFYIIWILLRKANKPQMLYFITVYNSLRINRRKKIQNCTYFFYILCTQWFLSRPNSKTNKSRLVISGGYCGRYLMTDVKIRSVFYLLYKNLETWRTCFESEIIRVNVQMIWCDSLV